MLLNKPFMKTRKNNGVLWEPPSSCVLWFPGQDDAQSATIRDRSGQGNHGTISGASWTTNSQGTWCLSFDSSDDYVTLGSSLNVSTGTLLAWVTVDSFVDNQQTIFTQDDPGQNDGDATLDIESSEHKFRLRLQAAPNLSYDVLSNDAATTGSTYLIAVLFGTGGMNLYINGVLQTDTDSFTGGITGSATAYIGGLLTNYSWSGQINLFRVLSTRWTTAQISSLYYQERHLFGV